MGMPRMWDRAVTPQTCFAEAIVLTSVLNSLPASPKGQETALSVWALSRMGVLSLLWEAPPTACLLAAATML